MDTEAKILDQLQQAPGHSLPFTSVVARLGIDQSLVWAAVVNLTKKNFILVTEEIDYEITRGRDWEEQLPERRALEKIAAHLPAGQTALPLPELPAILNKSDTRSEIKYLTRKGWCRLEKGWLRLTPAGQEALAGTRSPDEAIVQALKTTPTVALSNLREKLPAELVTAGIELLKGRETIIRIKERTVRTLSLTPTGEKASLATPAQPLVNQLTPELLTTGKWREVLFRPYDVSLPTRPCFPGKLHPLQRIVQEARRAFLEMGFEETASPIVETAFWDFDALFQPQDHPAREMQDTFYISRPEKGRLPDEEIVHRVAQTHENGDETGSRGWRYRWDRTRAEKLLLRTHTTAATIRALAQNPHPPRKVFCIGRVFRRENIDATHLPEFIQIDGIIIDDTASLATLFGTLTEFYRKMGAQEVRFRPSYFPYTEPSVEVFANLGKLGWVEMGGAGVFRPEVVFPFGCRSRVLAWGLGLERLAMMRFGITDIRKLYWASLNFLQEAKLCR